MNATIVTLNNTISKKADVELQCQQAKESALQIQNAREKMQKELAVQKSSNVVNEYEDKIHRRDSLISDLRKQIQYTDSKNNEFQMETRTLKSYIVDLKQMIKMLLNPEGLPGLDK